MTCGSDVCLTRWQNFVVAAVREQLPYPWVGFVLVSIFMVTSCGLLFALGWTLRFLLARIFHLASLQHDSLNHGQRRRQQLTATPPPHQQLLRRSRQSVLPDS